MREIEKTARLEQELSGQWKVYRQDITKAEPALQQPEAGTGRLRGHFTITESWLKSNRLFNK